MFTKRIESIRIEAKFCGDSSSHFFCCLIRKSYTENRSWFDSLGMNHRYNTFSDCMSFSWSCTSIDEDCSFDSFDCDELLWIELSHRICVLFRSKCIENTRKSEQKSNNSCFRFPIGFIGIFSCNSFSFLYTGGSYFIYKKSWISSNFSARVRESNSSKNS